MTSASSNALLSPSDVADLAGVSRPVVSNWRKRHDDFPRAIAGSEATPLFARDEVVAWLRRRGHKVEEESAGGRLWSALNAIRDRVPLQDAADFVLLLATLRRANKSEFEHVARVHGAEQGAGLVAAMRGLHGVAGLQDVGGPSHAMLRLQPSASHVVDAVARTSEEDLAEAVDFVLERLSRWQIKSGAESGFVGSRTSSLLASLASHSGGTVYDPACGIANVLIRVAQQGRADRLVGSDIDRDALRVATQRAYLHGARIDLVEGDTLAEDLHPNLRADVVVAEPPFGMPWDPSSKLGDPRFAFGVPPRMAADLAWVQDAIAHLAPEGRAYVLTSPSALFRGGAERQIRANLLAAGCVEAVIGLPSKMLPHTSIGPALWVLRPSAEPSDVLLIDASGVEEVEKDAAAWLRRSHGKRAAVGIDAPHALVPVTELLAADAVLTPAKWVGELAIDADAIASSFTHASLAMAKTIRLIGESSLAFDELAELPKPRIATVRDLIENGVVDLRLGRPDKTRDLDDVGQARIVRASDVRSRRLPPVERLAALIHPDHTEKGDVLVTTMNEVRAVVDASGGHLPSTGVDRLRVIDTSVITPSYLAAVITGSWNSRLQTGTTIQRAPIRDLEIPLIPESDQNKVVLAQGAVGSIREQSKRLTAQAAQVQDAILDALRYNVPLDPPDPVERHGHDAHVNKKDTR
jgi:hypothetical protein